ncbi:MAG: hypothetical protein U0996_16575 [Planctomycetaceae bacterium]
MASLWNYSLFGESFGPVNEVDLCKLIQSGTLGADDEITSAAGETVRLGEHSFFAGLFEDADLEYATDLDEFSLEDAASPASSATAQTSLEVAAPTRSENAVVSGPATQSKPAAGTSRREKRVDVSSSPRPAVPRKKRKVRREPHDPLLMEIFAELEARKNAPATSPGTSISDQPARGASSNSSSMASVPTPSSVSMSGTNTQLSSRTVETPVHRPMTPSYSASSSAGTSWKPPKKSSGSSFTMPEPRTLGIAGGALGVFALVGAFLMGWISLPASLGGGLSGASSEVVACYQQFQSCGVAPENQEWMSFQKSVKTRLAPLLEKGEGNAAVQEAGKVLTEVAACDPKKDADKLKAAAEKLVPLITRITG